MIRLLVLSVILGAITLLFYQVLPENYLSPATPYLILFFFVVTSLVHYILLKATANNARKFVNSFMLATLIKFFVYIPLIITYMYFNREDLLPFVISFFVMYICYTTFEVLSTLKYIKNNS